MTPRPLTDAEVERVARAAYNADPDPRLRLHPGQPTPPAWIEAVRAWDAGKTAVIATWDSAHVAGVAEAAEIRARDATQTVRGRVELHGTVALVAPDDHGNDTIAPVRLSLAAFPNLPDGATVEVTVRVIQETK